MARSSDRTWLAALALLALLALGALGAAGCGPRAAAPPPDPNAGRSRGEIELALRERVARADGDACAKERWLKQLIPTLRGLEFDIAEELLAEQSFACRQGAQPASAAPAAAGAGAPEAPRPAEATRPPPPPADAAKPSPPPPPADAPPPAESASPCSRRRAEAELRAQYPNRPLNRANIDAELGRCFAARLATCQLALDADVDEGVACWKAAPWPEAPAGVTADDVAQTGVCLLELKAVIADLRKCRTKKKPAELDACVAPYVGYEPQCPLLKAERTWKAFPGRADVVRVAEADAQRRTERDTRLAKEKADRDAKEAKLKAEQEAKEAKLKAEQEARRAAEEARIAKETERCFGRTTLEFAANLKAQPGPRAAPGCKYQVAGRVVSKNNAFVQVVDPSGRLIFLLRTKEPFADGAAIEDRTATFDSIEEAELADGTKRAFAVFKLDPAPPKRR